MAVTRYQGFMSYSHAADGKLAPAIHSALQRIAKPWYRLRSMRVFRDKSSLSANPALWPTIQQALGESDFFLLLASPEAANSKWVQQEVAWWLENRPGDKILVLLTGGELIWDDQARDFDWSRTTALPAGLRGRFANEPLWTDFRWARSVNDLSLRHSQFRGGILDLAAPLLGRPKDEIDGDDVRQHRRLKMVSWAAMLTILAFAGTAVWQAIVARAQRNEAVLQRQRAEERERIAVSRQLAAQADLVERETSNVTVRSLLSIEAARRSQNGDAIEALTRSLAVLPRVRVRDQGQTFATALSPDGRLFAIGIQGKRPQPDVVRVLKMADGRPLYELTVQSTPSDLVFTPDSQRLVVGGFQLKVLDAATGRVLSDGDPKEREYAISPDGRLALSQIEYARPRIVDLSDRREIAVLQGEDQVRSAAFSPDGRYLTTWSYGFRNSGAVVYDASSGGELFRVPHESDLGVTTATFSPDSRYLASGSKDHTYVHSVPDGKLVSQLRQGSWFVLQFSPNNRHFASMPSGGVLGLFSVADGSSQQSFSVTSIEKIAFSADGELIAIAANGIARVLETESGRELARVKLGDERIHSLSMSRDSKWLAAGGDDGVQLAEISNLRTLPMPCLAAEITEDGRRLLCISLGVSMVLDTTSEKPPAEPREDAPTFVKLDNSGRFGVTTGMGAPFRLVDTASNRTLWELAGDNPRMTFSPRDRFLAFSLGKTTHVVESSTGKVLARATLPAEVLAQRFNHDESLLAVALEDKTVRIVDVGGKERLQIPQDGRVHALAFAPGNVLAAGSETGSLRIFDAVSGREITHMPYAIPVISLQFSQNGQYLLTLGSASGSRVIGRAHLRCREHPGAVVDDAVA